MIHKIQMTKFFIEFLICFRTLFLSGQKLRGMTHRLFHESIYQMIKKTTRDDEKKNNNNNIEAPILNNTIPAIPNLSVHPLGKNKN